MTVLWITDKLVALDVLFSVNFRMGGKPEYPEKNVPSKGEINCGNSLT